MKKLLIVCILGAMLLSGCASAASPETQTMFTNKGMSADNSAGAPGAAPVVAYAEEMAPEPAMDMDTASDTGDYRTNAPERMIIHNANIEITVKDPQESSNKIQRMADEYGGFVIQSDISRISQYIDGYGFYYLSRAEINFRVPADRLNDALDFVRSQVNDPDLDIANESISGQDVTKEYTDLSAQLVSLEAYKETLVGFLDSAKKTEDALSVYREIQQVDSNIERIKGEMKYYEESSSYSAIHVTINQSEEELEQIRKELDEKMQEKQKDLGGFDIINWQPLRIAKQALEALVNVLIGIGTILIYIILLIAPIVLVIAAPIYLFIKWLARRKKKKAQVKEQ